MKTRLSWTIWALSLITLFSLAALTAPAATNYTSFSSLPFRSSITNADGIAFYWQSNGLFVTRRTAWSNVWDQLTALTAHSTNADNALNSLALTQTNFDAQFARVGATGTVAYASSVFGAVMTNQGGVWLLRTNGTRQFFTNNLAAAHAAEAASDLLLFGRGKYTGGFTVNKTIHWVGISPGAWNWSTSQHEGGATITGGIAIGPGCSNSLIENLSFEAVDTALACAGIYSTNPVNNTYRNLSIGATTGAGTHNFVVSGRGNLVENCKCYNNQNHGIALLGCVDTIVKDCVSLNNRGSSFVVKADPTQGGSVSNILIEGCVSDGPFLIQSVTNIDQTVNMSAVTIRNHTVDNSRGLYTGSSTAWLEICTGCSVSDLLLDNVSFSDNRPNGFQVLLTSYWRGGDFKNITVQNCSLLNPARSNCLSGNFASWPPDYTQFRFINNVINGQKFSGVGYSSSVTLLAALATNTLQIIGLPNVIANQFVTNGYMYFFYTNLYSIPTNLLTPGDPIWVTNGPAAGVYAYETSGLQSGTAPGPGMNGYNYIQVAYAGTNGTYSPASQILHGKVFARMHYLGQWLSSCVDASVYSLSSLTSSERSSVTLQLIGGAGSIPIINKETWSPQTVVYLGIAAHAWTNAAGLFIGAFSYPLQSAWAGQGFGALGALMEINAQNPVVNSFIIATNRWP